MDKNRDMIISGQMIQKLVLCTCEKDIITEEEPEEDPEEGVADDEE